MTLTNLSSDISIIWFWAGLFVLLGMASAYRTARRALRKAIRFRGELDGALVVRRLEVQAAFPHDHGLTRIVRSAEKASTPEELFACEADVDLWIYSRQQAESAARPASLSPTARVLETATANLRPFRDRYNEAAAVVASQRQSFPGAIIARSFIESDLPLLPDFEVS